MMSGIAEIIRSALRCLSRDAWRVRRTGSALRSRHPRGLWVGAVAVAIVTAAMPAVGETFPSKPITIIAHTAAGSSTDIFARELARAAEPLLRQPVVIVNRPGGSGAAQMAMLKSAPADGYTLGVNTTSHLTAWLTNLKGVYTWRDFAWISLNQLDPYVIVVAADSPVKSLKDLAAYAKKHADRKVNVGGFGTVGAAHNIAFHLFAEAAAIQFNWVAYPGGSQAMTALLGNHLEVVNTNPGPVLQFAEAGRVRVLGIMDDRRMTSYPDVPTFAEAGYKVNTSWKQIRGIYGPKGIPGAVQEKLAAAFLKAMEDPGFVKYMNETSQVAGNLGPADYTKFIEQQDALAAEWLQKLGLVK